MEHLRGEVQISMRQVAPTWLHLVVVDPLNAPREIKNWCERTMSVAKVLPPRLFQLKINTGVIIPCVHVVRKETFFCFVLVVLVF